ncbi:NlpC/P60 family protein [Aquipuribacter sp. MA13-6]|uniref:C40 family peptidase n=1 Tax=Aquipuribacter sp. MA13-6 TaxID=3440839 RepID=UPI003EEF0C20
MPSLLSRCALGAATLLAMSLVAAPAAQATDVDVDTARTDVQELGREVEIAAEDYNEIRVQLDAQKDRVMAAETRVSSQAKAIEDMTAELGALAVETFKRGGVDPQLAVVLGDPGQFATSSSTLTLMAERRSTSLTDLKGAQEELVRLEATAAGELAEVQAMEADLAERKTAIEARLAGAERRSTSLTDLKGAQEELVRLEATAAGELAEVQAMEADLAERKTAIEARLAGAEDVLAAAEAEAARIEAARRAAAERATRAREAAAAQTAAAEAAAAESTSGSASDDSGPASDDAGSGSSSSGSTSSGSSDSGSTGAQLTSSGTINCGGTSVAVPDDRVATVLGFACAQMGKPYKWGGSGPGSYDCSGLTSAAWSQVGVSLPHSSRAQAGMGTRVSRGDLRPGDLVFTYSPISHVGIYIGGNRMVAAPSAGDVVKIQNLEYQPFNTAVRL